MVAFLSLSTSLIGIFLFDYGYQQSGRADGLSNYWDAIFHIYNFTQTSEEIGSLEPAISSKFISDISKTNGIAEVHAVQGIPVTLPYDADGFSDFWIKSCAEMKPYLSYSEIRQDYQEHQRYYGMMKGLMKLSLII